MNTNYKGSARIHSNEHGLPAVFMVKLVESIVGARFTDDNISMFESFFATLTAKFDSIHAEKALEFGSIQNHNVC